MTRRTYRCADCGGTFETTRSDEDANAEAERLWGVPQAATHPGMAEICADCFQRLIADINASFGELES